MSVVWSLELPVHTCRRRQWLRRSRPQQTPVRLSMSDICETVSEYLECEEMKTINDGNWRGNGWTWGGIHIFQPVELAKPLLVVSVPNVHIAITTTSGKSIVILVEADSVHWVNVFDAILLHPVAFEGIFLFLGLGTWVEVFDSHPALYRANDVARLVGEAPQATCLCNRGMSIVWVWKGGLNKYTSNFWTKPKPHLIFQTGLPLLLNHSHITEIPHPHLNRVFKLRENVFNDINQW